jgi:hypothetical protein
VLPGQLGPLLHVQHAPPPGLDNTIEPGSPTPRTPPPPPEGGQISTGEEGSVSHRRRHRGRETVHWVALTNATRCTTLTEILISGRIRIGEHDPSRADTGGCVLEQT